MFFDMFFFFHIKGVVCVFMISLRICSVSVGRSQVKQVKSSVSQRSSTRFGLDVTTYACLGKQLGEGGSSIVPLVALGRLTAWFHESNGATTDTFTSMK